MQLHMNTYNNNSHQKLHEVYAIISDFLSHKLIFNLLKEVSTTFPLSAPVRTVA